MEGYGLDIFDLFEFEFMSMRTHLEERVIKNALHKESLSEDWN